ncbi:conserved hypothetical protein [Desulfamplus magnetovallimortis]|uniref:ATP-grasp domain-containing protein n=1 Tax=Desulfamplus magnetovallimortis TaxID=1246637 RepID=A0A1W1H8A9_9BACT|nr:hypothetical protein [Desulfamplus magnetovallimortis]SLM28702.1 conserved hypothetical protein [Desulfamplus magnetovallimortis]
MSPLPNIAIHEGLNKSFSETLIRFEKIFEYNKIPFRRVNSSSEIFWEEIADYDLFLYNFGQRDSELQNAKAVIPLVQNEFGIKCFPDTTTCWHYDDKIRQYYLSMSAGFPMAKSWVFWNLEDALNWIEDANFPVVFKLKGGAGSTNVVLIKNKYEAINVTKKMFSLKGVSFGKIPHSNNLNYLRDFFKLFGLRRFIAEKRGRLGPKGRHPYWQIHRDYVLFQKFFCDNQYDQRVTVIGKRAFTFLRYTRPNDFRASGSGLIDYDIEKNHKSCIKIAFEISQKMNFQSMAYDFVFDENKNPHIVEISYTFVDYAVRKCPGYFDDNLNWHEGHYWPQFSVTDMLFPDLCIKQPPDSVMR